MISVVGHKIFQRTFVVFSNLVRGQPRHDDGVKEMRPQTEIEKSGSRSEPDRGSNQSNGLVACRRTEGSQCHVGEPAKALQICCRTEVPGRQRKEECPGIFWLSKPSRNAMIFWRFFWRFHIIPMLLETLCFDPPSSFDCSKS